MTISMKSLFSLALLTVSLSAEELPSTPVPNVEFGSALVRPIPVKPRHSEREMHILDWELMGLEVGARIGDILTTEHCLSKPAWVCHEGQLPNALVESKSGFIAYSLGAAALSGLAQYELTKHGHRKGARAAQFANFSYGAALDVNNLVIANGRWCFGANPTTGAISCW